MVHQGTFFKSSATMFTLSKGEPPTPLNTATSPPTGTAPLEIPQVRKVEDPLQSQPASSTSASGQQQTSRELLPVRNQMRPFEKDSGFEETPVSLKDGICFFCDEDKYDDVFEDDESTTLLLELEDNDDRCAECGDSSCSCSRAVSSATVRAAISYTDPNTCDSDSSNRSSSPQSPPPSSWSIPGSRPHIHNDRLPCPFCSGDDEGSMAPRSPMPYMQNIVASRSYPGSYPASLLQWWTHQSSSVFPPRGVAPPSRSDDRRSSRNRRRRIDSDASSSSDENSADELFPTACAEGSYLGTMTEAEDLRVNSPEQLPDLVPMSSDSSSRRMRSQSVSIPLDTQYCREVGSCLRRLSNEFESRLTERRRRERGSSLTNYSSW